MLQTIEVEIDTRGHIHPLEKLPVPAKGKARALLTLLPVQPTASAAIKSGAPAFGVLVASHSVSLDEMDAAIRLKGGRL